MRSVPAGRVEAPAIGLMAAGGLSAAFRAGMAILGIGGTAMIADPDARDALPGVGVLLGVGVVKLVMDLFTVNRRLADASASGLEPQPDRLDLRHVAVLDLLHPRLADGDLGVDRAPRRRGQASVQRRRSDRWLRPTARRVRAPIWRISPAPGGYGGPQNPPQS